MPHGLKRFYGSEHLHFISFSCRRRRALLASPRRRDLFLRILEQVRERYKFFVVGHVVMPEHVHLIISEPERGTPSTVVQVLKQRVSRKCTGKTRTVQGYLWAEEVSDHSFWQRGFYDFNLWSRKKVLEKLAYIHENPVRRGLVADLALWRWSSYRAWTYNEPGMVTLGTFGYATLLLAQKGGAPARVA